MTGSPQGVAEYRYKFLVDAMDWGKEFAQERWYFIVLAVVVIALLWRSLRR